MTRPPPTDAPAADLPADLLAALARLDQPAAIDAFLRDLLADSERRALAERWAIVRMLRAGATQRAIRDAVGCSIATVSRGAAQVRRGGAGFELAFAALAAERAAPLGPEAAR